MAAAIAFDAARGRTVLYGGVNDSGTLADTWLWDGKTWSQAKPTGSPTPLADASVAYDEARQNVVLFGGVNEETGLVSPATWTWDGTTWTSRTDLSGPPARLGGAMAYDAVHHKAVLFGGYPQGDQGWLEFAKAYALDESSDDPTLGDTWTWDGSTWTQEHPSTSPPPRYDAMMAADRDGRLVLFGGAFSGHSRDDTWAWDGKNWTQLHPSRHPDGRSIGEMAYDPARRTTLLFGGFQPEKVLTGAWTLGDTWAWDGTTWLRRPASPAPSSRSAGMLAYSAASGGLVHFGGTDGHRYLADTWLERDG